MTSIHWTLEQVAEFLDISLDETRELVEAGFIHYAHVTDDTEKRYDASAVKDWRRGLGDGGERGAAYVRALLSDGAVQHA
jgi:hypothetical protein